MKRAILAVSFGTSYRETREKTIGAIENALRGRFAGYEVRRAFTSRMIIKKLAERDHIAVDTVAEAMERLVREGFEEVIVQPTHVMNGYENEDMLAQLERYRGCFRRFAVGEPLLSSGEDYRALARALRAELPDPGEDGGVVLVGHGTDHPANASYAALAHYFTLEGMDKWTVGTVEGEPTAADVRALLCRMGVRRVLLAPLLIVLCMISLEKRPHGRQCLRRTAWRSRPCAAVSASMRGYGSFLCVTRTKPGYARSAAENAWRKRKTGGVDHHENGKCSLFGGKKRTVLA